jgi:hypothetical protein
MSMYVATHHRIFRGAGNVFCMRATSTMTVQAMQTYIVIDVAFFPPRHPLAECIHVLPNTHKDTHI